MIDKKEFKIGARFRILISWGDNKEGDIIQIYNKENIYRYYINLRNGKQESFAIDSIVATQDYFEFTEQEQQIVLW